MASCSADSVATAAPTPEPGASEDSSTDSPRTMEPVWLTDLRGETMRFAEEYMEVEAKELLEFAGRKILELEAHHSKDFEKATEELKRLAEQADRTQADQNRMTRMVAFMEEKLDAAEKVVRGSLGSWDAPLRQKPRAGAPVRAEGGAASRQHVGEGSDSTRVDEYRHRTSSASSVSASMSWLGPETTPEPPSVESLPEDIKDFSVLDLFGLSSRCAKLPTSQEGWRSPAGLDAEEDVLYVGQRRSGCATPAPIGLRTPQSVASTAAPLTATPLTPGLVSTPGSSRDHDTATPTTWDGPPAAPLSPFVLRDGGGTMFGFTLRVADGGDLGVDLEIRSRRSGESALMVTAVKPDGAVPNWNRGCVSGPGLGKEVKAGDKIVAVNNLSQASQMLEECQAKSTLKLTVVRGELDCPPPAGWAGREATTVKRPQQGLQAPPTSQLRGDLDAPPPGLGASGVHPGAPDRAALPS